MKKLLIFMLVLGMASVSQAAMTAFVVEGYGSEYDGPLGVTIRIDLIADTAWSGAVIGGIVEADAVNTDSQALASNVVNMGGAVGSAVVYTSTSGVSVLDSGFQINYLGNLVVTVAATTTSDPISSGTVTVSFDYTLPSTLSSDYWVAPLANGELFYYSGGSFAVGESYSALGAEGNVLIEGLHIIPEPMTVLLLGLGGLLLRRRKG